MLSPPTIAEAQNFLRVATAGPAPTTAQLSEVLDALAFAYHQSDKVNFTESSIEAPRSDYKQLYRELSIRFPDFGYYAASDPTKLVTDEAMTGDAIDDLTDIVTDLREIVWRFENIGSNDAVWHFRNCFEIHWGRHLRELSLYLHAQQFG